MKRLLLATVLLSTAMSDNILTKEDRRDSLRLHEWQPWLGRENSFSRDSGTPDGEDFSSYATRVTPLPAIALSRPTSTRRVLYGTADPTNCKAVNPALYIALDFRKLLDKDEQFTSGCKSEKCRRETERWQIEAPLYVDEPHWIELESDYQDSHTNHLPSEDPFVVSRGKKTIRLQNSIGEARKTAFDYDELDDLSNERLSEKGLFRNTRSVRSYHEKRRDRTHKAFEKKEDDRETSEGGKTTNIDDLDHMQTDKDPFFLTRGKKLLDRKYQRRLGVDERVNEINTDTIPKQIMRGKRSINFRKPEEHNPVTSVHINERNEGTLDSNTNNKEISNTEGFDSSGRETFLDKVNTAKDSRLDKAKFEEDFGGFIGEKMLLKNREKRSSYESRMVEDTADGKSDLLDENLIDGYMERRNKHSDLMDILEEPFYISRGKRINFSLKERQQANYENLISELALKSILNKAIENEMRKCNSGMCGNDYRKVVKKMAPRDRRGALDDLLVKYDPFFVARGKRSSSVNELTSKEKSVDFESTP